MDLVETFFRLVPKVEAARAGDEIEEIIGIIRPSNAAQTHICVDTFQIFCGTVQHRIGHVERM